MRRGPFIRGRRKLLAPAVFSGVVLASILLLSVTGWLVWNSRQRAIQSAAAANETLVSVLDRHAAQMIDSVRIALKTTGQQLGPEPGDKIRQSSLDAWLAEIALDMPHLSAIGVYDLDSDALVHHFVRSRDLGEMAFKALAASARRLSGPDIKIDAAVFDEPGNQWLLPIGTAIPPRQGVGRHVAIALVSIRQLQSLYASLDTGSHGTVVLLRDDGVILARHPHDPERVGQNMIAGTLFRMHVPNQPSGSFQAASTIDGVERIVSYRRLDTGPLVVVVSRSVADVLARLREELSMDFAIATLCAMLLLGLGLLLIRIAGQRDSADDNLHATLSHMEQGLLMVGPDQRTEVYNQRALDLLGLPEELMARRPHSREVFAFQVAKGEFDGMSPEMHAQIVRPVLSETPNCYWRMRPNGTALEVRTMPLPNGGVVRTYTDITERRQAIEDMNASAAFANSLINSSPDCIQLLDLDGNVTFISDLGQELFEIADFDSVRGKPFLDFFLPEHRARVDLALRRVRGGQTDRFTRMCPTMGGLAKWWEFIITRVHEIDREPERLFVVARDVSARQAHAEELGRAKEAAERASLAKTQFLASMSHEIRTPLNAILGFATLARERQDQDPELRRQIELIQKAGEALLTIINDVLDLSKIEAGKFELEERPLDLRGLVSDCLSLTEGLARPKGLVLDCVVDPAIPARVLADEARLRQILLNLLNNAVKFTASGAVNLSVAPSAAPGRMVLAVRDTGIGIAADRLPHLFQDFVQVDGSISRQFGGTGLGLSISRRLATLMGGDIGADSVVGKGSTFHVTLPMIDAGVLAAPSVAATPQPAGLAAPRRILLVDDLDINLEIVGEMLATAGHSVSVASNGPSAIAAYREQRHDLILMDVQMPDMDGLETTRRIRELDAAAGEVPVIALTANVFSQQVASYREAGMNDHLGKPFHRTALLAMVERWGAIRARPDTTLAETGESVATPAETVVDIACQNELAALVGPDKMSDLLSKLSQDLRLRLRSVEPSSLRDDAHSITSAAGLLGFTELSAAARAVQQAVDCEADVAPPLMRLLAARTAALREIAGLTDDGFGLTPPPLAIQR